MGVWGIKTIIISMSLNLWTLKRCYLRWRVQSHTNGYKSSWLSPHFYLQSCTCLLGVNPMLSYKRFRSKKGTNPSENRLCQKFFKRDLPWGKLAICIVCKLSFTQMKELKIHKWRRWKSTNQEIENPQVKILKSVSRQVVLKPQIWKFLKMIK